MELKLELGSNHYVNNSKLLNFFAKLGSALHRPLDEDNKVYDLIK